MEKFRFLNIPWFYKTLFFSSCIFLLLFLLYQDVISRSVSLKSLIFWLLSIKFSIIVFKRTTKEKVEKKDFILSDIILLSIVSISFLLFFGLQPFHFHYDEAITAYTSFTLPSLTKIDWFSVFPEKGQWVSQFPILFYILQKPFLVLKPNLLMVRISTWPYTIGTTIFLYLLIKTISNRKMAIVGAFCFITLSSQLYLGSLGLHFHASVFFFILSIYSFVKLEESRQFKYSMLLGLSMATSYMTYTSSYITAPIILLFMFFSVFRKKKSGLLELYLKSLAIFTVAFFPLLIYAIKIDNFFVQRIDQVNIFNGAWKSQTETFSNFATFLNLLKFYTFESLQSLFFPNIGGHGEYWFGKESFFELFGSGLFILGLTSLLIRIISKKNVNLLFMLLIIIITFVSTMILTIHPPPFHRLGIAYPFIGFVIAEGIFLATSIINGFFKKTVFLNLTIIILTLSFSFSNVNHTLKMINKDSKLKPLDVIAVTNYLDGNIKPNAHIEIAAYPANAFGKELLFRTNNKYLINTNYLDYLTIKRGDILILHSPDQKTISRVNNIFPDALIIPNLKLQNYIVIKIN